MCVSPHVLGADWTYGGSMQVTFTDSRPTNHRTLMMVGNAVRWTLPLLAAAAVSAAIAGGAADALDRAARSPSMEFIGDPAGGHLVPEVSQAGRYP